MSEKPSPPYQSFVKYSSMGFQMLGMILLGIWAGWSLDKYFQLKFPAFMLILSLLGVIGSMVYFIRQIIREQ